MKTKDLEIKLKKERDDALEEAAEARKELERLADGIRLWRQMRPDEMRLRCGELSAQDIRNIKAILNQILPDHEN